MYVSARLRSNKHHDELLLFVFFFQAEDGIRDLVRSRGLGDVYKRQGLSLDEAFTITVADVNDAPTTAPDEYLGAVGNTMFALNPVSYTHLTLPTSDLV